MPGRVVGEIAQHPSQPERIAGHLDRIQLRRNLQWSFAFQTRHLGGGQIVQVDLGAAHRRTMLIGPRQKQEILHKGLHPVRFGQQRRLHQRSVEHLGMSLRNL